jgi:hypothetical protein
MRPFIGRQQKEANVRARTLEQSESGPAEADLRMREIHLGNSAMQALWVFLYSREPSLISGIRQNCAAVQSSAALYTSRRGSSNILRGEKLHLRKIKEQQYLNVGLSAAARNSFMVSSRGSRFPIITYRAYTVPDAELYINFYVRGAE